MSDNKEIIESVDNIGKYLERSIKEGFTPVISKLEKVIELMIEDKTKSTQLYTTLEKVLELILNNKIEDAKFKTAIKVQVNAMEVTGKSSNKIIKRLLYAFIPLVLSLVGTIGTLIGMALAKGP